MKRSIAGLLLLGVAGSLNLLWLQDDPPATPPHTVEPMPVPGTEPREPKPTTIVFGDTFDDVRVLRPKTIGKPTAWTETFEYLPGETLPSGHVVGGSTPAVLTSNFEMRPMGVGIREHGIDYGPNVTMEEYGAWLAASSPEDVDAFLAELRGE